jgi:hypothetical protein
MELKGREHHLNTFSEASIMLLPNWMRIQQKKENFRPPMMSIDAKILNKILENEVNSTLIKSYIMIKFISFQGCNIYKSINVI